METRRLDRLSEAADMTVGRAEAASTEVDEEFAVGLDENDFFDRKPDRRRAMETREFEIRTERMLLRPHRLEDADDVFEFAREPEVGRFLRVPMPYVKGHAVAFVARRILSSWDEHPLWAMVLEGKVVGGIGLRIDAEHARGALGYAIAKEHWGRGLTTEAVRAVVDWGFGERGLAKVYASADARNGPSQRVMEKVGMTREGMLRSHRIHRDERVDDVYYGLLRDEWRMGRS